MQFETCLLQDCEAALHQTFVELEPADTVGQQPARAVGVFIRDHFDASAQQEVGAGEARRAAADDGDAPVAGDAGEGGGS